MTQETEYFELTKKRIDEFNDQIWNQRGTPVVYDNPMQYVEGILDDAKRLDYQYGAARCILNMGMGAFILKHDKELSLKYLSEAYDMFREQHNSKWISNTLLTQAIITNSTGSPESALYFAVKGIDFYEKNKEDKSDVTMAYYVIGTVYKDLKRLDEAEAYFYKGIEVDTENNSWSARIYTGLSNILNERGDFEKAIELSLKSISILRNEKNKIGESRALNDIGIIYRKLKKYDAALDYFFQGLELRKESNVLHFILGSYLEVADTYFEMNDHENALHYLLLAEPVARETNHQTRLASAYRQIANLYKMSGQNANAIIYFEKFISLNTETNLKEREAKVNELQNSLLQEKEQEIERLKNVELKNAYDLISEKNKEIMDSIHYAKRIQNALLASKKLLADNLIDQFVLFKPKDIVSGDFYWATYVAPSEKQGHNGLFYLAVCDSTGHGVPGAFMSLLNITFLNEAIIEKKIEAPNQILNYVRERIIQTISKDGAQDGMDGILICIDQKNKKITYSAANNSPLLIDISTAKDLPYDKMPIGKGERTDSFTLHTLNFRENDVLYLITDGYADQFGGIKGKKFKHKQLLDLLKTNVHLNMDKQKEMLHTTFENWKGELEQVDDVCIIGIRL